MHKDPRNLIGAVSKALGRKLSNEAFKDRLFMQKGCYILNSWGYGPKYDYSLYIRGPYSSELADDYYELDGGYTSTDIPDNVVSKLSDILNRGVGYSEAYATVLLVKTNNPNKSYDEILAKAVEIKPRLEKEVTEACSSIMI